MRALITGASGYIGHHLARRALGAGWEVHALTRPASDLRGLTIPRHDIEDSQESVGRAVRSVDPDVILHLAADVSVSAAEVTPRMLSANVTLGLRILEAMLETRCRRLVNTGTFWEYATDGSFAPTTSYAQTKRAFQSRLPDFGDRGACITTLVLFDVYGPGDWRGKMIPQLLRAAREGRDLPMSPGEQRLDMVHVEDAAVGFMHAAGLPAEPGHRVFALDSGERHTLREIVALLGEVTHHPIHARWGALPYRAGQIMEPVRVEPSRQMPCGRQGLVRLPGWRAHISLQEGLRRVAQADP